MVLAILCLAPNVPFAASRFLVLSGGGSPAHNNHSQYLQTKTLVDHLRKKFGKKNVAVFFGAGNESGGKNKDRLADVRAKINEDGLSRDSVFSGVIRGNRPATEKNVVAYFKNGLEGLGADDTFFLLVSDHGMPNENAEGYEDNCIHLWAFGPQGDDETDFDEACLSRKELQNLLRENVKAKRTVFGMSQCYSGGFHRLSVDASGPYPTADPAVCGFTSVPEDVIASGCTDDVRADRYQGYERYFTEQITGRDVVTGKKIRKARQKTLAAAHRTAVPRDLTVDVPKTTSDVYLLEWYYAIWDDAFRPRTKNPNLAKIRKLTDDIVSLKIPDEKIPALSGKLSALVQERLALLREHAAILGRADPDLAGLLSSGSEDGLLARAEKIDRRNEALSREFNAVDARRREIYYRSLYRPWIAALKKSPLPGLNDEERMNFETDYLAPMEAEIGASAQEAPSLSAQVVIALSGLAAEDPEGAERFSRYFARRENLILGWAKSSGQAAFAAAASEYARLTTRIERLDASLDKIDRQAAYVRRILEERRQLAAAIAIAAMGDETAIGELTGLAECEATPY